MRIKELVIFGLVVIFFSESEGCRTRRISYMRPVYVHQPIKLPDSSYLKNHEQMMKEREDMMKHIENMRQWRKDNEKYFQKIKEQDDLKKTANEVGSFYNKKLQSLQSS